MGTHKHYGQIELPTIETGTITGGSNLTTSGSTLRRGAGWASLTIDFTANATITAAATLMTAASGYRPTANLHGLLITPDGSNGVIYATLNTAGVLNHGASIASGKRYIGHFTYPHA